MYYCPSTLKLTEGCSKRREVISKADCTNVAKDTWVNANDFHNIYHKRHELSEISAYALYEYCIPDYKMF